MLGVARGWLVVVVVVVVAVMALQPGAPNQGKTQNRLLLSCGSYYRDHSSVSYRSGLRFA